jgi:chemotaxis protein CheD
VSVSPGKEVGERSDEGRSTNVASPAAHEMPLPEPLPAFAHIRRYWSAEGPVPCAKLLPGEYYVTVADEMLYTVLGSCVSACVRDRVLGIGGMNHFMLPLEASRQRGMSPPSLSIPTRFGNVAMERLVNDILKCGGRRAQLEFKIVGGGRVMSNAADVGARNVAFVTDYLQAEGFDVTSHDVGGRHARRVQYFPATGRLRVQHVRDIYKGDLYARERSYLEELSRDAPKAGEVELF